MALQFHPAGARPVLSLRDPQAAPASPQQPLVAGDQQQPFVWAEGGKRRSPAEINILRALSQNHMSAGADFSPVQHWSQGLARVAQGLLAGLEERRANKAEQANIDHSQQVMGELTPSGGQPTMEAAMRAASDPYATPEVREMGKFWMDRLVPKPSTAQPYRWEDNAGNVWQLNPDGSVPTQPLFTDRAPKQMVANGQLITSTNPYLSGATPVGPGPVPAAPPSLEPGAVVDDPRLAVPGGAGSQAPRRFP